MKFDVECGTTDLDLTGNGTVDKDNIAKTGLSENQIGENVQDNVTFSSVQFSYSFVSDSLRPHGSQHARPPCSSPTPGVYSNSCPSSR